MSDFNERLNELIITNEIKPEILAREIGVALKTIYEWKAGTQQITCSNIISLSNFFNCTIDYLAGRNDDPLNFTPLVPPPFNIAIRSLMEKLKISTYKLQKETKYNGSYFVRWKNGQEPYLDTLIDLADYFHCSIDELVGRNKF